MDVTNDIKKSIKLKTRKLSTWSWILNLNVYIRIAEFSLVAEYAQEPCLIQKVMSSLDADNKVESRPELATGALMRTSQLQLQPLVLPLHKYKDLLLELVYVN